MPRLQGSFFINGFGYNNYISSGVFGSSPGSGHPLTISAIDQTQLDLFHVTFDSQRSFSRTANQVQAASLSVNVFISY